MVVGLEFSHGEEPQQLAGVILSRPISFPNRGPATMRKLIVTSAMLAVMAILGQSSAQEFDPALFKLFGAAQKVINDNPAMLASNAGVQKELKMDEEQIKAVKEKLPQGFGGFGGFGKGGKPSEDAQARIAKMMEKVNQLKDVPEDKMEEKIREVFKDEIETPGKEVEKILKPEQLTRLKQIARQQGGPAAYLKADNVKDLGIKDDQLKKLKEINAELDKDRGELFKGSGKGGFNVSPEVREKLTALTKEAKEKADEILTSDQKTKYKELIGEPYTVQRGGGRPPQKKKDD